MSTYNYSTYNTVRPVMSPLPKHLQYLHAFDDWLTMHDTFKGEREVKDQGTTHLPKTHGMEMEGGIGDVHYVKYKQRATFFEYVAETVLGMYGLFWQKEPQVRVPSKLEGWLGACSVDGDTFMDFYRELSFSLIWKGRYGFLVDIPDMRNGGDAVPWLVPYTPESITKWGEDLDANGAKVLSFVLLDESYDSIDPKTLDSVVKNRWRICGLRMVDDDGEWLETPVYYTVTGDWDTGASPDFSMDALRSMDTYVEPMYRGRTLPYIPFVFVNVTDMRPDIQKPPLLGLANISLAIYRTNADYREALHKQAGALLFLKGMNAKTEVLAGASAALSTTNPEGDAKYIEPPGNGIAEMRLHEEALHRKAVEMGISLLQKSSGDETGASVKQHITVRTATLKTISKTCAAVMMRALAIIEDWMGIEVESNIVPSTDFSLSNENPDAALKIWQMMQQGGLSERDYYEWLKQNDYTSNASFTDWLVEFNKMREMASDTEEPDEANETIITRL